MEERKTRIKVLTLECIVSEVYLHCKDFSKKSFQCINI